MIEEYVTDPYYCSISVPLGCFKSNGSLRKCKFVTRNSKNQICYTNRGSGEVDNEITETERGKFIVTYKADKHSPYQVLRSIEGQAIKDSPKTLHGKIDFKSVKIFGEKGHGKKKLNFLWSLAVSVK